MAVYNAQRRGCNPCLSPVTMLTPRSTPYGSNGCFIPPYRTRIVTRDTQYNLRAEIIRYERAATIINIVSPDSGKVCNRIFIATGCKRNDLHCTRHDVARPNGRNPRRQVAYFVLTIWGSVIIQDKDCASLRRRLLLLLYFFGMGVPRTYRTWIYCTAPGPSA